MDDPPTATPPSGLDDAEYGAAGLRLGVIDAATLTRARHELVSLRSSGVHVSLRWLLLQSGALTRVDAKAIEASLGIEVVDQQPQQASVESVHELEPDRAESESESEDSSDDSPTMAEEELNDAEEQDFPPEIADVLIDPESAIPFAFEDEPEEVEQPPIEMNEVPPTAEPPTEESASPIAAPETASTPSESGFDAVLDDTETTPAERLDEVPTPSLAGELPDAISDNNEAPPPIAADVLTPAQPSLTPEMIAAAAGNIDTPISDVFADDPEVQSRRSRRRILIGLLLVVCSLLAGSAYLPDTQPFRALVGGKESKGILGWWNQFAAQSIGGRTPSE